MSYDAIRISEQLRVLEPEINKFIVRYNASNGPAGGGPRQTVFLFPGGMATRLVRATTPCDPTGSSNQVFAYDEIWLNAMTFLGLARDLKMTKVAPNDYRDKQNKIIVSDGLVNLFGVTPYLGFTAWCEEQGLDYFVFPWDWRRAVYDVGDLFITHFLPRFQELVMTGCNNADPLVRFSLIGHSAGGMVVNWALRSSAPIMAGLDNVITVATPFYGYNSQHHRWFEGEEYLNGFGLFTEDIIRAICSFPGCYAWMFLPYDLFLTEQAALAADPSYPLLVYPSTDFTNASVIADPYDPQTNGAKGRYPSASSSGFDLVELALAKLLVIFLSSPLSPTQAVKFWNIRADTGAGNTLNETRWDWVPPTSPSPIHDKTMTSGDGAQPAWTARHIHLDELAPGHVISITSAWADHAILMSLPSTLQEIAGILGIPFL
jgi:hypothetical protein